MQDSSRTYCKPADVDTGGDYKRLVDAKSPPHPEMCLQL